MREEPMTLPSDLLKAIADSGGGQVSLVVGAGCSLEEPTGLPLAGSCAEDANRKLIADGILTEGECQDPRDLSKLADLVKQKNGGKQEELVNRLPVQAFKNATANEGHLITAALMLEGAIANVVTLNYDLAISDALSSIGVESEVSVICGPEQHGQLTKTNVIYLHRSVDSDPENWILTTEALENEWQDAWEETIVRFAIVTPVTVFAGMGSSCGVIRHSAEKLRKAVGQNSRLILATPGEHNKSAFARELKIESDDYVSLGWIALMRKLGERYHLETVAKVGEKCNELSKRENWVDPAKGNKPTENVSKIENAVNALGFLGFGRFRAAILLDCRQFLKVVDEHLYSIANLLLAVARVERIGQVTGDYQDDGHITFTVDGKPDVRVILVDGGARNYRWLTLETLLKKHEDLISVQGSKISRRVLASGMAGTRTEMVSAPTSIVGETEEGNILDMESGFVFWDVEQIRSDESALLGLLL